MQKMYEEGLIVKTKSNLQRKYYKKDAEKSRRTVTTWWDEDFLTSSATSNLSKLMGGKYFDNPKNINLLIRCLKMITKFDKNAIVLDFFSGSCTTAHAVMQFNAEDGGNRQFIAVQLPELVPETSEAHDAGFKTICDIAMKRLKLAGEVIATSNPEVDIGFRVFAVDSSNMNNVFYNPNVLKRDLLDFSASNIKSDRSSKDLLVQTMLELGIELSSPILKTELCGKEIYDVDNGYLIACFDECIDDSVVTEIAKKCPRQVVFRDSSMESDAVAINFEQIFKAYSPNTKTKVL